MGFSPGEFMTLDDGQAHWEYSGGHIFLWNSDESKRFMVVTKVDAIKMFHQLETLCLMLEAEDG